jgi:hypothetical protein
VPLFGKPKFKGNVLADVIEGNADHIEKAECKSRTYATYLAICVLLEDLKKRPNGAAGHKAVMEMLMTGPYQAHRNDVLLYLGWQSGNLRLKPEVEAALAKRHQ